jgi:hypothetical protein
MHSWVRGILPFVLLTVSATAANGSEAGKTKLLFVSSLHSAHEHHAAFDYDELYSLVQGFEPDFVGVEIRPEDIGMSRAYLSSNYPREMVELAHRYQERAFGFDWLGHEIAGVPIPETYFKDLPTTKLSAELDNDEVMMASKPEQIARFEAEQWKIIAGATPASLTDGHYGALCRQIDELEQNWLSGSKYEEILAFDRLREAEIARNLIRFIERHPGKRIIAVMGADHRTFAVEAVVQHFARDVEMLDIFYSP